MQDKIKLMKKAYKLFEHTTPLSFDCGALCSGKCCKGDSSTGMILFPYEDTLLKNIDGFRIEEANGRKLLICNGICDRKTRPLSCRIYPYFPMITDDGYDVRADIRGFNTCPVLYDNIKPKYSFLRKIRKIAKLFSQDEELKEFIINTNSMLDEILDFGGLFYE